MAAFRKAGVLDYWPRRYTKSAQLSHIDTRFPDWVVDLFTILADTAGPR